jgi:hypothetical protein
MGEWTSGQVEQLGQLGRALASCQPSSEDEPRNLYSTLYRHELGQTCEKRGSRSVHVLRVEVLGYLVADVVAHVADATHDLTIHDYVTYWHFAVRFRCNALRWYLGR